MGLPLASRRIWIETALAITAGISTLVVFTPGPDRTLRSAIALHDFGHVVAFGLVSLLLAVAASWRVLPTLSQRVGAVCAAALAAVLVGAVVEVAQAVTGGNADLMDIVRDAGGAVSVALLLVATDIALTTRASIAVASVASLVVVGFALPIVAALQDEALARAQYPVLASFESSDELARFSFDYGASGSLDLIRNGDGAAIPVLRLRLPPATFPGFTLRWFPRNWSQARSIRFEIVNPDPTPFTVTVMIDDAEDQPNGDYSDRFTKELLLEPGVNDIEILLADVISSTQAGRFDLARVESLMLFAVRPIDPCEIFIGPISLLP